jgi:hypothetical protein
MKFKPMKRMNTQKALGFGFMGIILLVLNNFVLAQNFSPLVESQETGKEIGIQGSYLLNSNILTANFTNTLYKGGFIDDALVDKASNRLGKNNRFGGDANYGLYFIQHPVHTDSVNKIGYYVAYNWKANLSTEFSEDLFNWVFKGNKNYLGGTSYLGGSRFNLLTWREIQGGLMWDKKTEKTKVKIGIMASFIQGRTLFNTRLTQLEVAMDIVGFNMDVKSRVAASISGTNNHWYEGQGYGGSIGAYLVTEYEKGTFKFEMNDLGIISFNKNTRQLSNDTLFRWEGYRFDSFKGLSDSISNFVDSENLKTKYRVRDEHKAATILTPAFFKLAYEFKLNKKSGLEFGLVERLAYGWYPYLYGHYRIQLGESFKIGARLSYGGYGGVSVGLYLDKKFGKHFAAGIGSNALEGFILPKIANGQACMINFRGIF